MTSSELKRVSLGRLRLSLTPEKRVEAERIADEVLEPYRDRDDKAGRIRPYNFGAESVLWLEREVRQRMGKTK